MDPTRAQKKFDDRQAELEDHAQRILVDEGISGLSIEKIASSSGYSRPTVYQHFTSKSAAFACVASKTLALGHSIMQRVIEMEGTPRERAFALITAFEQIARFHPDAFHVNESLGFPWAKEYVPEEIETHYAKMVGGYFAFFTGALQEAKERGELPGACSPGDVQAVASHTIMFSYGAFSSIIKKRVSVFLSQARDPWLRAREALHAYWDGVGWQPLSSDRDYVAFHEEMMKTIFPDYWLKAKQEELEKEVASLNPAETESGASG